MEHLCQKINVIALNDIKSRVVVVEMVGKGVGVWVKIQMPSPPTRLQVD